MFRHQPGVPENMTVQKFTNQHLVEEKGMYVILVEKHKTASIKSAGFAISLEEETIFRPYMKLFQPALLKSGLRVPQNFLLSEKGEKLVNVSKILNKFLGKIFPNGMRSGVSVPPQTIIHHLITTINRKATNITQEQRQMMYDYLCHSGKFR